MILHSFGNNHVSWNATNSSSGIYFVQLSSNGNKYKEVQKITYLNRTQLLHFDIL